jgi:hypothetical protein
VVVGEHVAVGREDDAGARPDGHGLGLDLPAAAHGHVADLGDVDNGRLDGLGGAVEGA